jgi:hypothetical protein
MCVYQDGRLSHHNSLKTALNETHLDVCCEVRPTLDPEGPPIQQWRRLVRLWCGPTKEYFKLSDERKEIQRIGLAIGIDGNRGMYAHVMTEYFRFWWDHRNCDKSGQLTGLPEQIILCDEDWAAFEKLILEPRAPSDALKQLMKGWNDG